MKRAVIFFACYRKYYFRMAKHCAKSVKRWMPDVDTVLLTERPDWTSGAFNRIVLIPKPDPLAVTFPPLLYLPEEYDSGIYVGARVMFLAPVYDAFELVEDVRTDIALPFTRGKAHDTRVPSPGIPEAFPHFRSGFVAFQHHDRMRKFFALWKDEYEKERTEYGHIRGQKEHPDQWSLRKALHRSDLSIVTLRINFLATLGQEVIRGGVRTVAFGKGWDLDKLAAEANRLAPHVRLFMAGKSTLLKG